MPMVRPLRSFGVDDSRRMTNFRCTMPRVTKIGSATNFFSLPRAIRTRKSGITCSVAANLSSTSPRSRLEPRGSNAEGSNVAVEHQRRAGSGELKIGPSDAAERFKAEHVAVVVDRAIEVFDVDEQPARIEQEWRCLGFHRRPAKGKRS